MIRFAWGSSSRGKLCILSYHSCHIAPGRAYRLGEDFEVIKWGRAQRDRTIFMGEFDPTRHHTWCSLFLVSTRTTLSWRNLVRKNFSVKAKIWYQETNFDMRNSIMILTFSVFDWKYLLIQKTKIVCQLELKFRTRLI